MPAGLHRTYGAHHLHFITNSCYHRLPLLDAPGARDRFLAILEQTRQKYRFVVVGYVVMPEHIHLLITEPEAGGPGFWTSPTEPTKLGAPSLRLRSGQALAFFARAGTMLLSVSALTSTPCPVLQALVWFHSSI